MYKRRIALLLSFLIICTPMYASNMVPLRQLASQENATINYYKDNGTEYIKFELDGVKLILNLTTGVVKNEAGKVVDVEIKINNGTTYVSSEEFLSVVQEEKYNKEFMSNLLTTIYNQLNTFFTSLSSLETKTTKIVTSSSSSSSQDTTTSAAIKSEMSNIYIKTFRNDNIFYTTTGGIKVDTTTSSGINVDVNNLFIRYGVSIKETGYQDFSSQLLINGEQVDEKVLVGRWKDARIMYCDYFIQDINLQDNDIIELRSNGWKPLKYIYKEDKQGFKYIEHQDNVFVESAERNIKWRLEYLFGLVDKY